MDPLSIIMTGDGSQTLRNELLRETYHSIHGAMRESSHVFIGAGLEHFIKTFARQRLSILEIGFGTGLNAALTLQYGRRNEIEIEYHALEPYPLDPEIWSQLDYQLDMLDVLHHAPFNADAVITDKFMLRKYDRKLEDMNFQVRADVIYFDAFAPSVQPELWHISQLKKIYDVMNQPGVFVTYSAKGQMKRDLRQLGLIVETLQGPPGKAEMTRAIKS